MSVPMKLCIRSKNLFVRNYAQAGTPYYVSVQTEMRAGHTYTISSNVPYAVPSNLYGIDYNNNMQEFQVYEGHPVTLTMGENYVALFLPYIKQTAQEGTTVNTYEGLDDGTYWIQIEEGTEATAYEPPSIIEETYEGYICGGKYAPTIFSDQCNGAYFVGTDDVTINQGVGIDLESGVYAFDSDGNELEFTYTPTSIDKCSVGRHTVTYRTRAIGNVTRPNLPCGKSFLTMPSSCDNMNVFTENRIVTIIQAKSPKISGIGAVTIEKNTDFDPMSGVSAVDDNGNAVDVEYSGKYTQSLTGNPVTFSADESDGVKSLTVTLDPIQDLNGYSHPWVGGSGKNLLENPVRTWTTSGITFSVRDDGSVSISGTATANAYLNIVNWATFGDTSLAVAAGKEVTVNGATTGIRVTLGYREDSSQTSTNIADTTGAGKTGTLPNDLTYQIYVAIRVDSGMTVNTVLYPMIRLASNTDPTWEPYSNICPISGRTSVETHRTGKNLLPYPYVNTSSVNNGITRTVNSDGSVTFSGTATANSYFNFAAENTPVEFSAGSYVISVNGGESNPLHSGFSLTTNLRVGSSNMFTAQLNATTQSAAFTPTQDGLLRCYVTITNGTTVNATIKPMLRLATDTDSTYEPYQGETYTTDLGRTVYGGTLDVVSGVLTVDRAMVTLNTANMNNTEAFPGWRSSGVRSIIGSDLNLRYTAYPINVGEAYSVNTVGTNDVLYLSTNDYGKTQTEWKALAMDVQAVIPYATPTTYQLTPQEVEALVGSNVVWSDGDVTVVFTQDIPQGETIQYASDGKYPITYSAEDECGNETEQVRVVTVA